MLWISTRKTDIGNEEINVKLTIALLPGHLWPAVRGSETEDKPQYRMLSIFS